MTTSNGTIWIGFYLGEPRFYQQLAITPKKVKLQEMTVRQVKESDPNLPRYEPGRPVLDKRHPFYATKKSNKPRLTHHDSPLWIYKPGCSSIEEYIKSDETW
jgi:hypothetical protein